MIGSGLRAAKPYWPLPFCLGWFKLTRTGNANQVPYLVWEVLSVARKPSMHEHKNAADGAFCAAGDPCGGNMEHTKSYELIRQLKEVKEKNEVTFPRIMDRMEKNGKVVSLTTLRRVFADGSENNANNFNYEMTLIPIAEALFSVEDIPTPANSPYAKEIDGLKSVIHVQNEEIARLHELKEHLEQRVTFLLEQIEKKDRRMDEKDEMIKQLLSRVL